MAIIVGMDQGGYPPVRFRVTLPPDALAAAEPVLHHPTRSSFSSRLIKRPIASIGSIFSKSTEYTARVIGISTLYRRARSTTERVVATPSTTEVVRARYASSSSPRPSASPHERLRPSGEKQV